MAIARPIRVLALLAVGLWVFFIYQIFGHPTRKTDYSEKVLDRDPLLDSAYSLYPICT